MRLATISSTSGANGGFFPTSASRKSINENIRCVFFLLVLFAWFSFAQHFFGNKPELLTPSSATAAGVDLSPPPAPHTSVDPVSTLPANVLQHKIPVQVRFIRLLSKPSALGSRLACNKTAAEVEYALGLAKSVWETQAGIDIETKVVDMEISEEMDGEYEDHLAQFGLTAKKFHGPKEVVQDLARIVDYAAVDLWVRSKQVSIYCIGSFVGNNAVADDNLIFVRTVEYRPDDLFMDNLRFARVLAHELGHSFYLHHPQTKFCQDSCRKNACNLMCQQKAIPNPPHDPRLAIGLTERDVRIARGQAAASYDIRSSAARAGRITWGLNPLEDISLYATKSVPLRLVLFPDAVEQDAMASHVRFQLAKFKPMDIAFVAVDSETNVVRVLAWNSFGQPSRRATYGDALPHLVFQGIDFEWWTVSRHVEAEITPSVLLKRGERFGLMFSVPLISVSVTRGTRTLGVRNQTPRSGALPEFATALQQGSFQLTSSLDEQRRVIPKMNVDVTLI